MEMQQLEHRIDVAKTETGHLWTYYLRTLDERQWLISMYLKFVAIAGPVIVAISTVKPSAQNPTINTATSIVPLISRQSGGLLLLGIFVIGIPILITVALESRNAENYLIALKNLRNDLYTCANLNSLAKIHDIRGPKRKFGGIRF